ncbi:S49 family peptidase [Leeuwenhoekiella sp. A16]|uniref:S49 family peptidase n=1 Tax=Leeuwenhoekiella sp. A16 TaxID=3141462 RepID=UPI003A7FCA2C
MLFSRTAKEIRSGLWALSPFSAMASLQLAHKILAGETQNEKPNKIDAAVRYLIDESGTPFLPRTAEEIPPDSIGVIEIVGEMIKYGNPFCYGADEYVRFAQQFEDDPNIIGQIWIMDTPGGGLGSVGPFRDFARNKKKPVLARVDMCASAGLWIASPTDHIQVQNDISSMMGSLGVMATLRSYEKYYEDLGIKDHVINADPSSYKNKEFKEALKGNYELIRKYLLNPAAEKFQQHVQADRRGKINTGVEGILEGRMFYGEESIEYGFADSMGTMTDAIEKVKELAAVSAFMNNNY